MTIKNIPQDPVLAHLISKTSPVKGLDPLQCSNSNDELYLE